MMSDSSVLPANMEEVIEREEVLVAVAGMDSMKGGVSQRTRSIRTVFSLASWLLSS